MSSALSKNLKWTFLDKILKLFLGMFVSGMIARHLQTEGFGELNYYLSFFTILSVLSTLGMNKIIVREVANRNINENNYIKTVFFLRFLWATIVSITGMLLIIYTGGETTNTKYGYVIFLAIIWSSFDVLELYEQGNSKFIHANQIRVASFITTSLIKVLLVVKEAELIYFLLATVVEYLFVSILFYCFLARENKSSKLMKGKINKVKIFETLKECTPEMFAAFASIIFLKIDQIMLFYLSEESEVGIYSAAAKITEAWLFIPLIIISIIFPKLVKKRKIDLKIYKVLINYLITLMIGLPLIVAFVTNFISPYVIGIIFGDLYKDSVEILNILIWGSIFSCLGLITGSWLTIEKKLILNLYRNLFGLMINIIFNILFIPKYGAVGAAYAMLLGLAGAYVLYNFLNKNLYWVNYVLLTFPKNIFNKSMYLFLISVFKKRGNKYAG